MKIKFYYDLNEKVNFADINAQKTFVGRKDLNLEDFLNKHCLKNKFNKNIRNADHKLLKLSEIINEECNSFQIVHLDIRGFHNSKNFWDLLKVFKNKSIDQKIDNMAFVFKANKALSIDEKSDSIIVFASIYIFGSEQEPKVMLKIRRIEILNLLYLEKRLSLKEEIKMEISFSSDKNDLNDLQNNKITTILSNSKKIITKDEKNDFNFFKWNDLISIVDSYFSRGKNNDKPLFSIFTDIEDHNVYTEFNNIEVLIGCSSNDRTKINEIKNPHIINVNDVNEFVPIKIKNVKEIDLVSKKRIILDELETELNNTLKDIKTNNDNLKNNKNNKLAEQTSANEIANILRSLNIINDDLNKFIKLFKSYENDKSSEKAKIDDAIYIILNDLVLKLKEQNFDWSLFDGEISSYDIEKINEYKNTIIDLITSEEKKTEDINKNIFIFDSAISKHKRLDDDLKNKKTSIKESIHIEQIKIANLENNFKKLLSCSIDSNWNERDDNRTSFLLNSLIDKSFEWEVTNKDKGLATIFKRYKNTFKNAIQGVYRNPYLLYSIFKTSSIESQTNFLEENIKEKYSLNNKQEDCVRKAINTRDIFYLQGPPGTGKTQTICCIAEQFTFMNQTVLMTSSTHEAISNFFDRLYENNLNNPNMILYKYRKFDKENNKNQNNKRYDENSIFQTFIEKIINFSIPKNEDGLTKLNNMVSQYINNYEGLPPTLSELESSKITALLKNNSFIDRDKVNTYLLNRYNKISNIYLEYNNSLDGNLSSLADDINLELKKTFVKDERKKYVTQLNDYDQILNIITQENDYSFLMTNISELSVLINKIELDNKSEFKILMKKYKDWWINNKYSKINDKSNDNGEIFDYDKMDYNARDSKEFLKYILDNRLINIIGITTTSRNTISINNEDINLFSDYSIDLVIIDEISKSSTPEIIQRAIIAKKVLFVGDYKQLPPSPVFSPEEIEDIRISINDNIDKYHTYDGISENHFILNSGDKKLFFDEIDILYKTSFFTTQVSNLKSKSLNLKENNYDFLNVQHRFTEDIMKCVNLFYDDEEKLKMPSNINHLKKFNEYILLDKTKSFQIVDTSYLTNDFIELIKPKVNYLVSNESFDQLYPLLIKDNTNYNIRFNEFNAFTICKIIIEMINKNSFEELINKIGIIAMTKKQKFVIINMLKNDNGIGRENFENLKIKVDTVDNFQGREKDIIIVDLVRAKGSLDDSSCNIRFDKRNLNFYKSPERLNVALSRAMSKLIIVGAVDGYLANEISVILNTEKRIQEKVVDEILKIAKNNNAFFKVEEFQGLIWNIK